MKSKRKRWYLLWFVGAVIWLTNFFDSFRKDGVDFVVSMQLLAAILFFAAGIVGIFDIRSTIKINNAILNMENEKILETGKV